MKPDKQLRNILIGTGFGVCLFVGLTNLDVICGALAKLGGLLQPVVVGGMLAFVLNVPMAAIENTLNRLGGKRKDKNKTKNTKPQSYRVASLALTLLAVVLVFALLISVVAPQLVASSMQAVQQVSIALPRIQSELAARGIDSTWLTGFVDPSLLSGDLMGALQRTLTGMASSVVGTVSSAAGHLANTAMAAIFTVYFLLGKEMLARHFLWVLRKVCPERACAVLLKIGRQLQDTYAKFFSGQCLEAVFLGLMMFAAFSIARLPYAGLVAVLTAVTSFIPYVGSFLSCAVAGLLILLVNPWQALLAVIVFQVVQFCENQFIYPRVVGSAVGLPPMYTLLAVFIGGALFGVVGMIFFIPLMAAAYALLQELKAREDAEMPPREQAGNA